MPINADAKTALFIGGVRMFFYCVTFAFVKIQAYSLHSSAAKGKSLSSARASRHVGK
jgi:hypothetical protein